MLPYQVLTACAAHGLLVRAQEVVRRHARMIRDPTSGGRPILLTSSRALELLRTVRLDNGLHVLLVSHVAEAVRAHAERCREHPRSGSRDR